MNTVLKVVLPALLLSGCKAWTMDVPTSFAAEPVAVAGHSGGLTMGVYSLTGFQRDWTRGSALAITALRTHKRQQKYEFHVVRADAFDRLVQCEFSAKEKKLGMGDGFDFVLGEGAELACTAFGADSAEHKLILKKEGDAPMVGTFEGAATYRIQAVGTAKLSNSGRGPIGGFHIFSDDRLVALVQILNDQRVLFASGLDEKQRDDLAPAIVALLLLDETITEFD